MSEPTKLKTRQRPNQGISKRRASIALSKSFLSMVVKAPRMRKHLEVQSSDADT